MRRALDTYKPITTVHGQVGYGYFGKHAGYDYGVVHITIKAPENGVIMNVKKSPDTDGGNIIEMQSSKYDHRFLHLKSIGVKIGQVVKEGQNLGVTGNTGNVGYHLHHDTRIKGTAWKDSYANYVDWESIIKSKEIDMYKGRSAKQWYEKVVQVHGQAKRVTKIADDRGRALEVANSSIKTLQDQVKKLGAKPKAVVVEVGETTRSWFEKLINIFRR